RAADGRVAEVGRSEPGALPDCLAHRIKYAEKERGVAQPGQSAWFGTKKSLVRIQSPRLPFVNETPSRWLPPRRVGRSGRDEAVIGVDASIPASFRPPSLGISCCSRTAFPSFPSRESRVGAAFSPFSRPAAPASNRLIADPASPARTLPPAGGT